MGKLDICTAEHIQLNSVLVKMVLNNYISEIEREQLLHKAGLLKLEDDRWKDLTGSIIVLPRPETMHL